MNGRRAGAESGGSPACPAVRSSHRTAIGSSPHQTFPREAFFGLTTEVEESRLDRVLTEMENDPEIEGVEPDIFVDYPDIDPILPGTEPVIPWGGDRIGATETARAKSPASISSCSTRARTASTSKSASASPTSPTAEDRHGVHLSGTAVALDTTTGVVGVAPGAKIHRLKVLDDRSRPLVAALA